MISDITVPAKQCTCDLCGHIWTSFVPAPPVFCPNTACRSRRWNGDKRPNLSQVIKLPASRPAGRPKTQPALDIYEDEDD